MFDQSHNQVMEHCTKCKKLHPDTGLFSVWEVEKEKPNIIKLQYCQKCFNLERSKFFQGE
jgi:hypothetical protein